MNRRISAIRLPRFLAGILRDRGGATAVEFAFIALPLVIISSVLLELAIILFDYHTATEATRRGIRTALTNAQPVADIDDLLTSSNIVCTGTVNGVQCTGGDLESASAFDAIVVSMQQIMPVIGSDNVVVTYSPSRLDAPPNPGDIIAILTPLVTVSVVGLQHQFLLFPDALTFTFPSFSTSRVAPSEIVKL